jgi:hypothetical protein
VKDRDAFHADPDVKKLKHKTAEDGFFNEDDSGYFSFGWIDQYPSWYITYMVDNPSDDDDASEKEVELDFTDVVQRHIFPGDVCRIQVSGNEKLRYIGGGICWVTSKGKAYFDGETCWDCKLNTEELAKEAVKFLTDISGIV